LLWATNHQCFVSMETFFPPYTIIKSQETVSIGIRARHISYIYILRDYSYVVIYRMGGSTLRMHHGGCYLWRPCCFVD